MGLVDRLNIISAPFAIYGAQVVAYGAYTAIAKLYNRKPECFVVTRPEYNPREIDGIPVRTLDGVSKDWFIIVGVTELLQNEIVSVLRDHGYHNLFVLTQHEEYMLMSEYFKSIGRFPAVDDKKGSADADLAVFEVRNHRDRQLINPPSLQPFEYSLQAGAALTDRKLALYTDNSGGNISEKNPQYCEMTGTYWVWKNTDHAWIGMEHYRRHLLVKPEMIHDDVDVIMPLPYISYPDILTQFRRFVKEEVVQALLYALETLHPETFQRYWEILNGPYQYTYNLVCARRDVFDQYCEWFFAITEYMEKIGDQAPDISNTRALSYVAEVLTNLYFMDHHDQLNIFHVEKAIYV